MKKCIVVLLGILVLISIVNYSYAGRVEDAKREIAVLNEKIKKLEELKKLEEKNLDRQLKEKEQILKKVNQNTKFADNLKEQAQLADSALDSIDAAIELTEQDYNELMRLYEKRLCAIYKSVNSGNMLITFAECKSIREVIDKIKIIRLIARLDKDMLERLKRSKQEIIDLKTLKFNELNSIIQKIKDVQQEVDYLEISRGKINKRIEEQKQIIERYDDQEDKLLEASHDLEQQLKILDKGVYVGGRMVWPLPSVRVVNRHNLFGMRLHPIYKVWRMHTGIDIGGRRGLYIAAANDGIVVYAGNRHDGYGNIVIINHGGGIMTVYAHIDKKGILVKKGQYVKAGQVIAKTGSTGLATGPHLHFEVREWGKPVNPLKYIPKPKAYF